MVEQRVVEVYGGCIAEGIRVIDVRHEQMATHAADGYFRLTGKTGCAAVAAGPGTMDAITGVANAFYEQSAILLIGGLMPLDQRRMGTLGDLPHTQILSPITKFSETSTSTKRIAESVSIAFRECYLVAGGRGDREASEGPGLELVRLLPEESSETRSGAAETAGSCSLA